MIWNPTTSNYTFVNWTMETMGARRVMGDAVLLPNGLVVVLNGAMNGVAGDSSTGGSSKAHFPQFWPVLYDPAAPNGTRFTRMARSPIARMYHSTAALTPDGTVLVAGCDRCDYFNVSTSVVEHAALTVAGRAWKRDRCTNRPVVGVVCLNTLAKLLLPIAAL